MERLPHTSYNIVVTMPLMVSSNKRDMVTDKTQCTIANKNFTG